MRKSTHHFLSDCLQMSKLPHANLISVGKAVSLRVLMVSTEMLQSPISLLVTVWFSKWWILFSFSLSLHFVSFVLFQILRLKMPSGMFVYHIEPKCSLPLVYLTSVPFRLSPLVTRFSFFFFFFFMIQQLLSVKYDTSAHEAALLLWVTSPLMHATSSWC